MMANINFSVYKFGYSCADTYALFCLSLGNESEMKVGRKEDI